MPRVTNTFSFYICTNEREPRKRHIATFESAAKGICPSTFEFYIHAHTRQSFPLREFYMKDALSYAFWGLLKRATFHAHSAAISFDTRSIALRFPPLNCQPRDHKFHVQCAFFGKSAHVNVLQQVSKRNQYFLSTSYSKFIFFKITSYFITTPK